MPPPPPGPQPENILLVGRGASQVRVIDFGSSCYSTQRVFTYIQSRFYRAPEVSNDEGAPTEAMLMNK